MGWGPGIHREEIWHWFDERHSKGVAYLLYGGAEDYVPETKRLYGLRRSCFECESQTCQFNHGGECRFALVHERKPRITDDDGCIDYDYREGDDQLMKGMPYSIRLMLAQMAGNNKEASRVVDECFVTMTKKFLAIAHEYDSVDLPLVIATMQIAASAMMPILSDSGRELVENLVSHTHTITVDLSEMRRQASQNNEEEER